MEVEMEDKEEREEKEESDETEETDYDEEFFDLLNDTFEDNALRLKYQSVITKEDKKLFL